jgi:enoyl-[acyl-carrier-protein] reductase (NADH)
VITGSTYTIQTLRLAGYRITKIGAQKWFPLREKVAAEIANTVAFLCGDQAAAINGQAISLSGGEI